MQLASTALPVGMTPTAHMADKHLNNEPRPLKSFGALADGEWSEWPDGLSISFETSCGQRFSGSIPWRQLRQALKRYDKKK